MLLLFANVAFVGLYQAFRRMVLSSRDVGGRDTARVSQPEQPLMAIAMLTSLIVLVVLGLWTPGPLDELLHSAAAVIGGRA